MRIFKIKRFHRWSNKHELSDKDLINAVDEISHGLADADLGGNLYKKRIGTRGRGKSGSARTLLAYRSKSRTVFLYAFEKNKRDNISDVEKDALKKFGNFILNLSNKEISKRIDDGSLIEIKRGV